MIKLKHSLLCVLISACLCLHAWYSAANSLEFFLKQALPTLTNASLKNAVSSDDELARISNHLLEVLSRVDVTNPLFFELLKQLEVTKIKLINNTANKPVSDFTWPYGEGSISLQLTTKPHFNIANTLLLSLLLSLFVIQFHRLLNKLITDIVLKVNNHSLGVNLADSHQQIESLLYQQLIEKTQLTADEVNALCRNEQVNSLSEVQLKWFIVAVNNQLKITAAIAVARSPEAIVFNLSQQQVVIHGLTIFLAKTPLFYYYWYAQREINKLPPYTNPPTNKPDRESGEQLAQLMTAYNGHQKAIRDLTEEGLKGKTLDQNRNKIKAQLQKTIGDLADDYLFISERDPKTARYKYRLNSAGKTIKSE